MKLYKIENKYEVWYFTTKAKLARYLGCMPQRIENTLRRGTNHIRDWNIEIIEDDYIMSKFIDPEPNIYTAEELVLTKQMFELLRQVIENDKRIENLENRIEGLKKNIEKANVQK